MKIAAIGNSHIVALKYVRDDMAGMPCQLVCFGLAASDLASLFARGNHLVSDTDLR